jgi:predicted flavoprotein YhiN
MAASAATRCCELPREKREQLLELLKALPLEITGTRPIKEATATRGGVGRDEIDPTTMQSKLCPGLFFAGEVIDVDGPCGGYNLQIAWSTGALAGKSAASSQLSAKGG